MTGYARPTQVNRVAGFGSTSLGHIQAERNKRSTIKLSKKGKRFAAVAVALIMIVFTLVSLAAYTATLQHKNNVLQAENSNLQAEIDAMESQINDQTKVTSIEKTATKKYGMVYPTADNCIKIKDGQKSEKKLASMIKTEAYS